MRASRQRAVQLGGPAEDVDVGEQVRKLAAERAELKQQTRQLHEAAQRAEAAAKELRAALKLTSETAEDTIVDVITPLCAEVTAQMGRLLGAATERANSQTEHVGDITLLCVEKLNDIVRDAEARMTGYENYKDIAVKITADIHSSIDTLSDNEEFLTAVADMVASHFKDSTVSLVARKSAMPLTFHVRPPGT